LTQDVFGDATVVRPCPRAVVRPGDHSDSGSAVPADEPCVAIGVVRSETAQIAKAIALEGRGIRAKRDARREPQDACGGMKARLAALSGGGARTAKSARGARARHAIQSMH